MVEDVRQQSSLDPPSPQLFACYCQMSQGLLADVPALAIRTTGDPAALATTLRAIVHEVAPAAGLTSVMTMEARLTERLAMPRLLAALVLALGASALLIAGIGLAGALAHQVTLRSREIGIRAALGATPGDITGSVVRGALTLTLVGTSTGLVVAFVLARWLTHVVTGVGVHDRSRLPSVPSCCWWSRCRVCGSGASGGTESIRPKCSEPDWTGAAPPDPSVVARGGPYAPLRSGGRARGAQGSWSTPWCGRSREQNQALDARRPRHSATVTRAPRHSGGHSGPFGRVSR